MGLDLREFSFFDSFPSGGNSEGGTAESQTL